MISFCFSGFLKRSHLLLFLLVAVFFWRCNGQQVEEPTEPDGRDIFLLIGQSNMAGRAEIEEQDKDSLQHVFLFTGVAGREWEKAANPLNRYSTVRKELSMQKLGPGYTFAKRISEAYPGREFGLVVNARGGTAISEWMPGKGLYNEAVKTAKQAMQQGRIRGILWHQGESDVSRSEAYLEDLVILVQTLRTDLGAGSIPFVAGQLSEDRPQRAALNKILLQLPGRLNNCGIALSEGTATIDSTHFDTRSQRLMGERYGGEMIRILGK